MTGWLLGMILAAGVDELPTASIELGAGLNLAGDVTQLKMGENQAHVLIFVTDQCPIANRYAPEIQRIEAEYVRKGVGFSLVYLGSPKYAPEYRKHWKDFGYQIPGFMDPELKWVKATGVTVTPEVVTFDSYWRMKYRGRIDNQNVEHGKVREGFRRDLRVALDEMLAGLPVSQPTTAAVGCIIPRN
ncbi:hypothetical protein C0431_02395 [bacterium]|nr:hypothetical protein [bacterium]